MSARNPSEAETRATLIDRRLLQAGWSNDRRNLIEELLIQVRDEEDHGYADYVLLNDRGLPITVVEAKRTRRDPLEGQRQAEQYAEKIEERFGIRPFIFLTNGHEILFWDREEAAPRPVSGFFNPDDLERLALQRKHGEALRGKGPSDEIIDRPYQIEAVKRVAERVDQGHRNFLVVMATGTGKTRTAIALVDLLIRHRRASRILFLADRRELVRQAMGDFKRHMPDQPRARLEGGSPDHSASIHVTTYPSMMQIYNSLSPGYYDLIICDESHRSIYNRYKVLLEHFDARRLGLTATPTDYIDHNTFQLFDCPDGEPTFYYDYDTAVRDGYLAQYRTLEAQTHYQIEGIKAGKLPSELLAQLAEQGVDPGELDFEGSEIERRVINQGTTEAMVSEFMQRCRRRADGTLPAKTIFFAIGHAHARRIHDAFRRLYPDLTRRGAVQIIDSHMERADTLIDDFKGKELPRIAISVDMLDTGIDVPAVQNLVFAKPLFSYVKFWQMIGRGTRLWDDPDSGETVRDFLIFDFFNVFDYFRLNPESDEGHSSEPLPSRLFRLLLEKLSLLDNREEDTERTIDELRRLLAALPLDNIDVAPHREELERLAHGDAWRGIDDERRQHLSHAIAPLLRYHPDAAPARIGFRARCERLALAHLRKDTTEGTALRAKIEDDLRRLPGDLKEVNKHADALAWALSDGFWEHLDLERIEQLRDLFAPLMSLRERQRGGEVVKLNLSDHVASRRWIIYGPSGEGAFAETYRTNVEARIKALADREPALIRLRRGEQPSDDELDRLTSALDQADWFITEERLRDLYEQPHAHLVELLRHILDLDHLPGRQERIMERFDRYIADHPEFTAPQVNFLRTVRKALLSHARISEAADLEEPPFNRLGGVHRLFPAKCVEEIVQLAHELDQDLAS